MKQSTLARCMRISLLIAILGAAAAHAASCSDMYGSTATYDDFVDAFGAKDPSQFDLTRNVCAYIAMESLGIAQSTEADVFNAIRKGTGFNKFETNECKTANLDFSACTEEFLKYHKNSPKDKRFKNIGIAPECLKPEAKNTPKPTKPIKPAKQTQPKTEPLPAKISKRVSERKWR